MTLYKHYNTKLYVVVIDMTYLRKQPHERRNLFCKHVENDYSTLNYHPNEDINFFHSVSFAIQYYMKVTKYFRLKFFFTVDLLLASILFISIKKHTISIKKHTILKTPFV